MNYREYIKAHDEWKVSEPHLAAATSNLQLFFLKGDNLLIKSSQGFIANIDVDEAKQFVEILIEKLEIGG